MVDAGTTIGVSGVALRLMGLVMRLPRLRVRMVYRWISEDLTSRSLGEGFDPRDHHHYDMLHPAKPGWAVAIEIENKGRRPVTIEDYCFTDIRHKGRIFGIIPRFATGLRARQDGFSDNPRLPIYLQSRQVAYIMEPPNRFVPINGACEPTEVMAFVSLRRRVFKVAKPRRPLYIS